MANLVRIYKSKRAINEVQITKPMSRSPPRKLDKSNFMPTCHHYGVSNIKRNYFKLRYQLATLSRPPPGSKSNIKTTQFSTIIVASVVGHYWKIYTPVIKLINYPS